MMDSPCKQTLKGKKVWKNYVINYHVVKNIKHIHLAKTSKNESCPRIFIHFHKSSKKIIFIVNILSIGAKVWGRRGANQNNIRAIMGANDDK